jgi:hypothetical protein
MHCLELAKPLLIALPKAKHDAEYTYSGDNKRDAAYQVSLPCCSEEIALTACHILVTREYPRGAASNALRPSPAKCKSIRMPAATGRMWAPWW